MTVEETKAKAKAEKRNLIFGILTLQSAKRVTDLKHIYTMEELENKNLTKLREIYDKVHHG